jgi:thiol-disulfide isomerase/thioredoxin
MITSIFCRRIIAVVSATGIFALGCAKNDAEAQPKSPSKGTPAASASGAQVYVLKSFQPAKGGALPDFSWTTNGKEVKFSEFTKGKAVFLNYWATWCPPCRREIPDIIELAKEYGDKVVFIGIALENESAAAAAQKLVSVYVNRSGITYINLVGSGELVSALSELYGAVQAIPTTFIFGKDGKIAQRIDGSTNKESFLMELKKAM